MGNLLEGYLMAVRSKMVKHYLTHSKSRTYRVEDAKVYPTKYSLSDSTGTNYAIYSLGTMRKGTNPSLGVIINDIFCCLFNASAYVRDGVKFERIALSFDLKSLFELELVGLSGWAEIKGDK